MQSRFDLILVLDFLLIYILGFPDGSTFALPNVSMGIHHGYPVTLVLSIVPEKLAGRFSKNDCTPSELSLSALAMSITLDQDQRTGSQIIRR